MPSPKKPIEQYEHTDKKRLNNPPVGLVTPETDRESGKKRYSYDPHLDPQLVWAGKAEHTSFEVPYKTKIILALYDESRDSQAFGMKY